MKKMNVLLLHCDQLRYDCLGCNGNEYVKTPNIDNLALQGINFSRHMSSNAVCMPSRASLMTGLYSTAHNVWTNGVPLNRREYLNFRSFEKNNEPPFNIPETMADAFVKNGYQSASFGKLHLTPNVGPADVHFPENWSDMNNPEYVNWHGPYYGFEYVEMTLGHGEQPAQAAHYGFDLKSKHRDLYDKVNDKNAKKKRPFPDQQDLYASEIPNELHNSQWLAKRFENYLDTVYDETKPFFVNIGFPDPHHPFTPSEDILKDFINAPVMPSFDPCGAALCTPEGLDKSIFHGVEIDRDKIDEIKRYTYAMIYQIDLAIGRIIKKIKEKNLWEDTVIAFTSDHGDYLGDHGLLYKRERGTKSLLHIPFILNVPGIDKNLKDCSLPMSNVDVMPTLLACAGVKKFDKTIHGENIFEHINSNENSRYVYAFHFNKDERYINYTICDERFMYVFFPHAGWNELYDHINDPGETCNLAYNEEYAQKVMEFKLKISEQTLKGLKPNLSRIGQW